MNRRRTAVATVTLVGMVAGGLTPALATTAKKHKAKPLKGTFSYTDTTPDPTVSVVNSANSATGYCKGGVVPAGPGDVNSHTLKVTGRGTLTVAGHTTGDWAMMITDRKGTILTGSDGGFPQDQEGAILPITKAGTYSVVYCNLGGAPTATADYRFKPR